MSAKAKLFARTTLAGAALALSAGAAFGQAVTKLTAYPATWDTSHAGASLPFVGGWPLAFNDEFKTLSVASDGVAGSRWYAPIHSKLGTGTLAQASNRQAISVDGAGLELHTINPSSSGAGGTDANVETMDNHGHGFAFTNGYMEIEAALPAAHGSHAGLWLLNVQNAKGHGEIDAPETYGAADHVWARAAHFWPVGAVTRFAGPVSTGLYGSMTPATYYGNLHRYGVLVTSSMIYVYDDSQCALGPKCPLQERGRIARLPEESNPYYILMSAFTDANRKDGYQPATMTVRYVKVWGK